MISCAQANRRNIPKAKADYFLLFSRSYLCRHLICLVISLFVLVSALLGPAEASYNRQMRAKDPFRFESGEFSTSRSGGGGYSETGVASWYGTDFHGKRTSSGERYNMHAMTAAHRLLPMDTLLLVRNLDNGKEAVVRVNDRGPFVKGRILDLSKSAAKALKITGKGTARVKVVALSDSAEATGSDRPARVAPQDQPLDATGSGFYVQIATFAKERNAMRMRQRIADAGHTTTVKISSGKKPLYRVLVYAGKDLNKAMLAKRTLQQNGHKGAFVLSR